MTEIRHGTLEMLIVTSWGIEGEIEQIKKHGFGYISGIPHIYNPAGSYKSNVNLYVHGNTDNGYRGEPRFTGVSALRGSRVCIETKLKQCLALPRKYEYEYMFMRRLGYKAGSKMVRQNARTVLVTGKYEKCLAASPLLITDYGPEVDWFNERRDTRGKPTECAISAMHGGFCQGLSGQEVPACHFLDSSHCSATHYKGKAVMCFCRTDGLNKQQADAVKSLASEAVKNELLNCNQHGEAA